MATQFSLEHNALEIYLSGCDGYCGPKCHNQELWNFNIGKDYKFVMPTIKGKLEPPIGNIIRQVWILGGEPLLQKSNELEELLWFIKDNSDKEIVLFTRFSEDYLSDELLHLCDYIKCGKYDENYLVDGYEMYGITLATSNQYVIKTSDIL